MTPVNILILDDRPENVITLEALLQREDIKLFSTTSPNEALKLVWENPIAIALVDVQMPEMDGFEFVEILKANPRTKDIMVLFVTAISKEAKYAVKGFGAGAIDYLYKPLDAGVTLAKVDSFIQLARYQAEIVKKNEELENCAVVIKNSADIICTFNIDTYEILTINPAVERITGYKPDDLIGKPATIFALPDKQAYFTSEIEKLNLAGAESIQFECVFCTTDEKPIWAGCRAAVKNKTVFLNISDITAQKEYQNELIGLKDKAEQGKKTKETFLANMSHELRTPVNGIIGVTELLIKTELNEQQRSMVDLLNMSSQSLLGVINDILDISKIDAGKFTIIRSSNNLHDLLRAVYGLLKFKADEQNIVLQLNIAADVPEYLMLDSLRLNQILMNLLSNAIKFTEFGYVTLKVVVLARKDDKVHLKFSVADTGIGIAADKLESIFDSFEQAEEDTSAKFGGTGLGLAIVKRLAELKGGDINVSSEQGKGSEFTFTNWFALADAPQKELVKVEQPLISFENISILVAEDNFVNQFILSKMLKDWGVNVEIVDTGLKVIDKLRTKNYHLVLMDTHMPEMNGYEAARVIRNELEGPLKNIPIISLSAASLGHEQDEAIKAGMDDVLSKPFQPGDLHKKITELLKKTLS